MLLLYSSFLLSVYEICVCFADISYSGAIMSVITVTTKIIQKREMENILSINACKKLFSGFSSFSKVFIFKLNEF